jgi:hypothetical protein
MDIELELNLLGIKPVGYDKKGPKYSQANVEAVIVQQILTQTYFKRVTKYMNDDIKTAIDLTQDADKRFSTVLDAFTNTHNNFTNSAKKASASVRIAADNMAAGLAKIEKAANFDRLERMVTLLERAAVAMSTLAEMEKSGQLAKLSEAIKK